MGARMFVLCSCGMKLIEINVPSNNASIKMKNQIYIFLFTNMIAYTDPLKLITMMAIINCICLIVNVCNSVIKPFESYILFSDTNHSIKY